MNFKFRITQKIKCWETAHNLWLHPVDFILNQVFKIPEIYNKFWFFLYFLLLFFRIFDIQDHQWNRFIQKYWCFKFWMRPVLKLKSSNRYACLADKYVFVQTLLSLLHTPSSSEIREWPWGTFTPQKGDVTPGRLTFCILNSQYAILLLRNSIMSPLEPQKSLSVKSVWIQHWLLDTRKHYKLGSFAFYKEDMFNYWWQYAS